MAIEIKPLTINYISETMDIVHTVFEPRPGLPEPDDLKQRITNGEGIFYIAIDTDTNQVVGFKFGYIDGEVCIGHGIGVLPDYRRQGIATQMLHAFEADLRKHSDTKKYYFGSNTLEGVPFHIASGYHPQGLIQFLNPDLRSELDFSDYDVTHDEYNKEHKVYQIYFNLEESDANLQGLEKLQQAFPQTHIQFFFSKDFA